MTKRLSLATAALTVLSAFLAAMLVTSPAFAHHKDGHQQGGSGQTSTTDRDGDADSDAGTAHNEDNDTNDGNTANNVSDDGDNAHPSGKDRSVENGGSGNQGNSESDPDDDGRGPDRSNGGPDKPNGSGGDDLADQDGNNGCGNDDDFEDDNEGWCGKPDDTTTVPPVVDDTETPGPDDVLGDDLDGDLDGDLEVGTDVLGEIFTDEDVVSDDEAAGVGFRRPAAGALLPFTGGNVVLFLMVAMGLLGVGVALLRTRRN